MLTLDWTYNPLVALYFATCSNFDKDGCVFQKFPNKEAYQYELQNPFSVRDNLLVVPNQLNIRYKNQNGIFVIYSQPNIEDWFNITCKYIIPSSSKRNIQITLEKIGFTRSFIYPSLDSLSTDIVDKYKLRYSHCE